MVERELEVRQKKISMETTEFEVIEKAAGKKTKVDVEFFVYFIYW